MEIMKDKGNFGLGLIGVLLIIGALVITAGGVLVWRERTDSIPSSTPTPTPATQTQPTASPAEPIDQCSGLNEKECLANSDCIPVYGPSCPACMDIRFERCRERNPGEVKKAPWGVIDESKYCAKDQDCILIEETACLGGCESCEMLDYSSPLFEAFNKTWCQKNQPEMKPCPHCDIQRTNKENLKAKCIKNICTKTK